MKKATITKSIRNFIFANARKLSFQKENPTHPFHSFRFLVASALKACFKQANFDDEMMRFHE